MERARSEGVNLEQAWRNLIQSHTIPTTPLDNFFKPQRITPHLGTLGISGKLRKELPKISM